MYVLGEYQKLRKCVFLQNDNLLILFFAFCCFFGQRDAHLLRLSWLLMIENIFPLIHYVTFLVRALLMILKVNVPVKQLSKDSGCNI